MPTVAEFYGIVIQMYFAGHNPPHFHARYGNSKALVRIADGEIIQGRSPPAAARLVREWALARRDDLAQNWRCGQAHSPMQRIVGLDGEGANE